MSAQAAVGTVTAYLRLVEERRIDEASRLLDREAKIVFPGGVRFASLDEQMAASRGRYRSVRKTFEGFDVVGDDDTVTVYVFGELHGEDLAGRPFSGVRFIDRFEIVDGLIIDHRVWNDLGEASREAKGQP